MSEPIKPVVVGGVPVHDSGCEAGSLTHGFCACADRAHLFSLRCEHGDLSVACIKAHTKPWRDAPHVMVLAVGLAIEQGGWTEEFKRGAAMAVEEIAYRLIHPEAAYPLLGERECTCRPDGPCGH